MKKVLETLLKNILREYGEKIDVNLLIQDLYLYERITHNEVQLSTHNNLKMDLSKTMEVFKLLICKSDDTICDLQRIFKKYGWTDMNQYIQSYLRKNDCGHLIIDGDNDMVSEDKKGETPSKSDAEQFYAVERNVFKDIPQTCGVIENLSIETVDLPPSMLAFNSNNVNRKTYKNFSKPRGMALIINNKKFGCLPERKGTDVDARNMELLLENLDYKVEIKHNLTSQNILSSMEQFAKKSEHIICDSTVVVILTHGNKDTLYGTDGQHVSVEEVVRSLNSVNCPGLFNKPKIFIIQACRGESRDRGQESSDCVDAIGEMPTNPQALLAQLDEEDIGAFKKIPSAADVLIAYATIPGFVSWRNCESGSWFIQAICEVFQKNAKSEEIMHLFTEVNRIVAERFSKCGHVQVPEPCTRLRKKFYFYPGIYI